MNRHVRSDASHYVCTFRPAPGKNAQKKYVCVSVCACFVGGCACVSVCGCVCLGVCVRACVSPGRHEPHRNEPHRNDDAVGNWLTGAGCCALHCPQRLCECVCVRGCTLVFASSVPFSVATPSPMRFHYASGDSSFVSHSGGRLLLCGASPVGCGLCLGPFPAHVPGDRGHQVSEGKGGNWHFGGYSSPENGSHFSFGTGAVAPFRVHGVGSAEGLDTNRWRGAAAPRIVLAQLRLTRFWGFPCKIAVVLLPPLVRSPCSGNMLSLRLEDGTPTGEGV